MSAARVQHSKRQSTEDATVWDPDAVAQLYGWDQGNSRWKSAFCLAMAGVLNALERKDARALKQEVQGLAAVCNIPNLNFGFHGISVPVAAANPSIQVGPTHCPLFDFAALRNSESMMRCVLSVYEAPRFALSDDRLALLMQAKATEAMSCLVDAMHWKVDPFDVDCMDLPWHSISSAAEAVQWIHLLTTAGLLFRESDNGECRACARKMLVNAANARALYVEEVNALAVYLTDWMTDIYTREDIIIGLFQRSSLDVIQTTMRLMNGEDWEDEPQSHEAALMHARDYFTENPDASAVFDWLWGIMIRADERGHVPLHLQTLFQRGVWQAHDQGVMRHVLDKGYRHYGGNRMHCVMSHSSKGNSLLLVLQHLQAAQYDCFNADFFHETCKHLCQNHCSHAAKIAEILYTACKMQAWTEAQLVIMSRLFDERDNVEWLGFPFGIWHLVTSGSQESATALDFFLWKGVFPAYCIIAGTSAIHWSLHDGEFHTAQVLLQHGAKAYCSADTWFAGKLCDTQYNVWADAGVCLTLNGAPPNPDAPFVVSNGDSDDDTIFEPLSSEARQAQQAFEFAQIAGKVSTDCIEAARHNSDDTSPFFQYRFSKDTTDEIRRRLVQRAMRERQRRRVRCRLRK